MKLRYRAAHIFKLIFVKQLAGRIVGRPPRGFQTLLRV
jgi:hypothetical protein